MQVVASVAEPIKSPVMISVTSIFGVKIVKSSNHFSSQTITQIELKLEASGQDGDSELLKSSCSEIQNGCHNDHLQIISAPI